MTAAGETVTELDADSTGSWLVTNVSGSTHIWNLDENTVTRLPAGFALTNLTHDGTVQPIVGVVRYPKVGAPAVFAIPGGSGVPGHVKLRMTSTVQRIERLGFKE
jgi:hypothetical protein